MWSRLKICEQFALDLDVKFNAMKYVVMRIGERFDVYCVVVNYNLWSVLNILAYILLPVNVLAAQSRMYV